MKSTDTSFASFLLLQSTGMSSKLLQMQAAYKGADQFMAHAIRKINQDPKVRRAVAQIVPMHVPGLISIHPSIDSWMRDAEVRLLIFTHVDLLSDEAVNYVLQSTEEADPELAVVVMDTRNAKKLKSKKLKSLKEIFLGAMLSTNSTKTLLCGPPNAGKSSIILPLTRDPVNKIRARGDFHMSKVSPRAGRTVGIKEHRLTVTSPTFLMDTPGLLPYQLSDQKMLEVLVSGSLPDSAGVNPRLWDLDAVLGCVINALNFHADMTGDQPPYVQLLGLDGPTKDPALFLSHFKKSDINPMKQNEKASPSLLVHNIIGLIRKGQLGPLLVLSPEDQPYIRDMNVEECAQQKGSSTSTNGVKIFNRSTPIIYINSIAKELQKIHRDNEAFEVEQKAAKRFKTGGVT